MPIYEYLCEDCGTKFEKLVRRQSDVPGIECPSCGRNHLRQELSTFAAHAGGNGKSSGELPMCPSGGVCRTPGACGMNFD
jgi:putative FmdB family regulatory protein